MRLLKRYRGSYKTDKIQETASLRSEFLIQLNGLFNTSLRHISCTCDGWGHVVYS